MPSLDNPHRFDLVDTETRYDGTVIPASLERRTNGDWVRFDDYEELLKAHDALVGRLEQIVEIAR